jgi:phage terminase large subunit-like protein
MSVAEQRRRLEKILERRRKRAAVEIHVPSDPVEFCNEILGSSRRTTRQKFLRDTSQFVVLRWSRQSGKTFIVAAMILWFALHRINTLVLIVAPSFRQSKAVIRKIAAFVPKIKPKWIQGKVGRTKIDFTNGSRVEALPANPDTIRGPTADMIYCDEMNFIRDDEDVYDAILFTLGTTNGRFIATSTPWNTDSVFYKMCFDPAFADFSRHHVTWQDALEPNGPLKKLILEKIRRQLASDPWRWTREMEADYAEDQGAFLPSKLIARCVDGELTDRDWFDERAVLGI